MGHPLRLQVFRGDELLRTEQFDGNLIKIGRLPSAHLRLEDDRVSRIHSVIEVANDGRASIVDMGSAAGTFVNGKRVSRRALGPGDQISVGGLRIVVDLAAVTAANDAAGRAGNAAVNAAIAPAPPTAPPAPAAAPVVAPPAQVRGGAPVATPAAVDDGPEGPVGAEVLLFWGDTLLDARTVVAPGKGLPVVETADGPVVVTHVGGEYAVVPPGGAEIPISAAEAVRLAIGANLRVEARLRAAAPAQETRWWERANWRFVNLVLLLGFVSAVLVLATAGGRGATGPALVPPLEDVQRLVQFVAPAPPPRPVSRLAKGEVPKADDQKPGESGERHRAAEGQMGKKDAPKTQLRSAPKAVDPNDKEIVKHQGLLAVLGNGKGAPEGLSTVLGRGGLGGDLKGAVGNMFGAAVGDSFGFAGLGLKGTGAGGGGSGETIGIGAVGTKGRGGGMGGYGAGVGGLGQKGDTAIGLPGGDAKVLGSIDPELIRRVIREHASQVRYCYEQQLALNPKLEGKVAIRWQIDAGGRASQTVVEQGETTLASAEVHRCIMSRIVTWDFPKPKGGGIAIVKYPWILRTSGGDAPPGA